MSIAGRRRRGRGQRTTRRGGQRGPILGLGRPSPRAPALYPRQLRQFAAIVGRQPWPFVRVCVYARYWADPEIEPEDTPLPGDPALYGDAEEQVRYRGLFLWGWRCLFLRGEDFARVPVSAIDRLLAIHMGRRPIRMVTARQDWP